MAHNLDFSKGRAAFVSYAEKAWHGLGTTLNNPLTVEDALNQGGLNFDVYKLPNIHYLPNGQEIISEDSFFTFRSDVNKVLGSRLGKDYQVFQNAEALNLVDEVLQSGRATIETAGAIDEGRKVFVCLKVNQDIIVNSSDTVQQYVLIATSHDGSMSITAMPTNVRVVCQNTLSAALHGTVGKIKIRHTSNASVRMEEAMKVLKLIHVNTDVNSENYGKMAANVISKEQMFDYFGNIFMTADEIKQLKSGKRSADVLSTRKQNILGEVLSFANRGTGQSIAMKGNDHTMWSAYNAVTGYITRKRYSSADDRANSLLFGTAADQVQQAGVLALEPAKIVSLRSLGLNSMSLN
jgi:phage/plasmid-like protein (TIGR03299 family)